MTNVNSFLDNKGEAKWQFLIFKHNQEQVQQAKKLSKQMGFVDFYTNYSDDHMSLVLVFGGYIGTIYVVGCF